MDSYEDHQGGKHGKAVEKAQAEVEKTMPDLPDDGYGPRETYADGTDAAEEALRREEEQGMTPKADEQDPPQGGQ